MHPRQPVPSALLRLAALQDRVVTREQALGCGLGRHAIVRLVRDGLWVPLARGVYLVGGGPAGWPALAWAGVLLGGDRARLGGTAAAHAWGWTGSPPEPIDVLVPGAGSAPSRDGRWRFRREQEGVRSPRSPGSPPRTTVEDTALDLVGEAAVDDVVTWLSAAVQSHRTTPQRLRVAAEARQRVRHRALVLRLLDDLATGAHSALEIAYLHDVERAHGLPAAERQVRRRSTVADALSREFGVLVELDGRAGHTGEARFRDLDRDNVAPLDGLVTLRYGHRDVSTRPCVVAAQVAGVLAARGWPGRPSRCHRCRLVA
ncbi:very-short-patch-repair endonuclease [Friedmanniella endophytica]|uniref:Very-short-patch-repair endonuclease n=1 Tax=Microlunatus kandeliicorticis TaxID=1759536 RepID=A0A7W3IVK0_9ACTN|nr:type IV toxin-antitoxin system AbiEi family antitoxin domain-containing protein [Microlunatus kandeliicorticis]MBA8796042.1 very-short-patch-repair endonuclease [Microlunatus kandeliicorticis]